MYSPRPTSRPLSYAPTPYSYQGSLSASINLDEEVKLAESASERDLVDSLAEIYSIIRTLDGLEKAYIKDAVTESDYAEMCSKLLKQYKSILSDETVSREFQDLDNFSRKWDVREHWESCTAKTDCQIDRMSASDRKNSCRYSFDRRTSVACSGCSYGNGRWRFNEFDRDG